MFCKFGLVYNVYAEKCSSIHAISVNRTEASSVYMVFRYNLSDGLFPGDLFLVERRKIVDDDRYGKRNDEDAADTARCSDQFAPRRPRTDVAISDRRHRNGRPPERFRYRCVSDITLNGTKQRNNSVINGRYILKRRFLYCSGCDPIKLHHGANDLRCRKSS